MKKTMLIVAIVALICISAVFILIACDWNKILQDIESTGEFSADSKEGCLAVIESFFEDTLDQPCVVVTAIYNGETYYTATLKGDTSLTVSNDGQKVYCYKQGDNFYYVVDGSASTEQGFADTYYYCSDSTKRGFDEMAETWYNQNYRRFMSTILLMDAIPETSATFALQGSDKSKGNESSAQFSCTATTQTGSATISAESKNDLVQSATVTIVDNNNNTNVAHFVFSYENADITLPDTDAWDAAQVAKEQRIEAAEAAIEARDLYFEGTLSSDNLKVTANQSGLMLFSENIANDIDYVLVPASYKTYTYYEGVGEDCNAYYVYDGNDAKYYMVNPEDDSFEANRKVYWNRYITSYDDEKESYDFSCTQKDDELTFKVKMGDKEVFKLEAAKVDGNIVSTRLTYITDNVKNSFVLSFEYGNAQASKPDLAGFQLSSPQAND